MLKFTQENNFGKQLSILFFSIVIIEAMAEMFGNKLLIFIFKPLLSIVIMILYWNASKKKDILFFTIFFLSLVIHILFISNTENLLYIGLLILLVQRVFLIYYIIKLINLRDYIPLLIAIIPFLFVFFYLLSVSTETYTKTYFVLIFHNIFISILGGLTLSQYIMNYKKSNSWFFIFGLVCVMQYFIVFIEKYYLSNLAPLSFRPLAMILNSGVFYSFYRFVIDLEKKCEQNNNLYCD